MLTEAVRLYARTIYRNWLDVIASGPLNPDNTTYTNALEVVERYSLDIPTTVTHQLRQGADGKIAETPSTGDSAFKTDQEFVPADGMTALKRAVAVASRAN